MNIHTNYHHGTLRLLYKILGTILIGFAIYFVLIYLVQTPNTTSKASPVATTTALASITTHTATTTQIIEVGSSSSTPRITITNADANTAVSVETGQKFTLELSPSLKWNVIFLPHQNVRAVPDSDVNSQGSFVLMSPGTVTLTATGRPSCKVGVACPMFIAIFTVTISAQ